jgi:hypothetical protein
MNEVTIETERLLLRMFRENDFEDYATLCASPDVMRFLGGKPFSRVEAWRHMAMMIGHWYFRDLDMSHAISLIHRDNGPSIRVAERLGESLEGSTEVMGMPVLIYGIDRDKV